MAKKDKDFYVTFNYLRLVYGTIRAQALVNMANDIRHRARFLMKPANKTKTLKGGGIKQVTGEHSKPGDPPYRRKGGLYNKFSWSAMDTDLQKTQKLGFVVGPEVFPGRTTGRKSVPAVLERGGESTVTSKSYLPVNRRRFSPEEVRNAYVNKYGERRADRPKRVTTTYGDRYRYFYSNERWNNASQSPRFTEWANRNSEADTYGVRIAPRPYMKPAVAYETSESRWKQKIEKARRYYLRKNRATSSGLVDIDPSGRYAQNMPEFMK